MDMQKELDALLQAIKDDYAKFMNKDTKVNADMRKSFNANLKVKRGSKYIKIIKERSVWGFIVATDNHPKFRKGDILKAASYNAPATNHARGNIIDGGYRVEWTGPLYLR